MNLQKLHDTLPANVYNELCLNCTRFAIDTDLRLAHFLAQIDHESGGFKRYYENLNYSGHRLLEVFPKYFNYENVSAYAGKPAMVANRVYADRMGNRSEASGDGYNYRGRGYIQLTGRNNYQRFADAFDPAVIDNPDLVAVKYPLTSAMWFWNVNNVDEAADEDDCAEVTKKINGGVNGLKARELLLDKYKGVLIG